MKIFITDILKRSKEKSSDLWFLVWCVLALQMDEIVPALLCLIVWLGFEIRSLLKKIWLGLLLNKI